MISKDRLLLQQQIYNFLRTVTIKYEPIAEYINSTLIERGYAVNEQDPTTWKYYLNMQGLYHVSDELMYITSLDTREQILFSPEIFTTHPRTRSVYVPGGLYYNRLCETYPDQVDLIKSILFPVTDVEKAIDADNLVLLGYGSGYLEDYEENPLVDEIERFLEILKERWYFDFLDDEPYFYVTFWGSLWTYLAMLLMSARESYVNTPYVHSWHIWNKLKTKGLDDYSDVLDRAKSMMLYQNINYFKANAGKHSNLIILANRLLSDFGVSIYGRKVVQETETGAARYQLTPQLKAVRIPTDNYLVATEISSASVATIQSEAFSKGLSVDNSPEALEVKERKLGDTKLNNFMTKFLEIRPITKSKVYSDTLNMFLLETLTTSILNDYYSEPILVTDQATDVTLYLRPRELLALYHYATLKSLGITAVNIPTKFSFYRSFSTTIKTPAKTIMRGDEKVYTSAYLNPAGFLSGLEYTTNLALPSDFSEMLTRLWLRYLDHLLMDQNTKIGRKGYILQYLASLCHERRVETHQLVSGFTDYATWLGNEGIDVASTVLSQYDLQVDAPAAWGNLADSIMSALVPITQTLDYFGNFTLSDYGYDRLRQLFVQMCSYRVAFLESSRDTPEFAIGAKWSNEYGPDAVETYADMTTIRKLRTKDISAHNTTLNLHSGFCENIINDVNSVVNYTVTTVCNTDQIAMVQPTEHIRSTMQTKLQEFSEGRINIAHNRMAFSALTDQ